MRVLVTGAGGLVGGRLAALFHEQGRETLALFRSFPPPPGPRALRQSLDDEEGLARLLDRECPTAVVHAAALAQVDRCYAFPDEAGAANVQVPTRLARLCRERGLRLVALSTDLVFSGEQAPLSERDRAEPRSVYGRTKLAGEDGVLVAHPEAAVVRVALVVGRGHGPRATASEAIARSLRAGERPRLFTDEHRTPIDPESLAAAVLRILDQRGAGRYHLGGSERVSRYELGVRVARALGLDSTALVPGRQVDHVAPEPRAADVSLDSSRAQQELGFRPRPLDEALRESRLGPA